MSDPVRVLLNGRFAERHLKDLQFDIYAIMIVFGLGKDSSMPTDALIARLSKIGRYKALTKEQMQEMLVQCTDISFLFHSEVRDYHFYIRGRNYGSS